MVVGLNERSAARWPLIFILTEPSITLENGEQSQLTHTPKPILPSRTQCDQPHSFVRYHAKVLNSIPDRVQWKHDAKDELEVVLLLRLAGSAPDPHRDRLGNWNADDLPGLGPFGLLFGSGGLHDLGDLFADGFTQQVRLA